MQLRLMVLSLAVVFGASAASAATLNVVEGALVGASNVDVGGQLYDVEFVDGTCVALFDGCDSFSDFTFQTPAAAAAASQALLNQVLLDDGGGAGKFDSDPELTNGCSNIFSCNVITPDGVDAGLVSSQAANNLAPEALAEDRVVTMTTFSATIDQAFVTTNTFAIWTPLPSPVPSFNATGAVALATLLVIVAVSFQSRRPRDVLEFRSR